MWKDESLKILKNYFGYDSFRKGQKEAIENIMLGKDTFIIMPTGGGKSLCYQVPALLLEGATLVISPLISLMKDQVDTLNNMGISATYINSTLNSIEIDERINGIRNNQYKLIYLAPERLDSMSSILKMNNINISLIAIDEAHCVSKWGHDFRPSYRNVQGFINQLVQRPRVLACTATATEIVKEDIIKLLGLKAPNVFFTGFNRENLNFKVFRGENNDKFILDYIAAKNEENGIIYASTRRETEHIYNMLCKKGIKAGIYHAGLEEDIRKEMQENFMYDNINIMVATNAFGMGIDKSNVRFVIHNNMPKNLEAYYQEAGRAGRDGEPSECILLFNSGDVSTQRYFIESSTLSPDKKTQEYDNLRAMVDYCYTSKCLRKYILEYFGEEYLKKSCDNCSNCNNDIEEKEITLEAQMIFSCVYRLKERYGISTVVDVLKGSKNQRVLKLSLDKISTYALMKDYDRKYVEEITNKLVADGYLITTNDEYPVLKLTLKAVNTLKNKEKVYVSVRKVKQVQKTEDGLFTILKALRKSISEELNLPPYIIFHDSTLKELSTYMPKNEEEFLNIKGVGESKFAKYGERFLEAIIKYTEDNKIKSNLSDYSPKEQEETKKKIKSYYETYELYKKGLSIEEIAKFRGLTELTIQNHIFDCVLEGLDVNLDDFIPEYMEDKILEVISNIGASKLKPIKEQLPEEVDYAAIKAVICKHNL